MAWAIVRGGDGRDCVDWADATSVPSARRPRLPSLGLTWVTTLRATGIFGVVRRLVRFGLVGTLATATYFLLMLLLIDVLHSAVRWAHVAALGAGLLVSYAGHHSFTFERRRDHLRYFTRFCIVSAILFLVSSLFVWEVTAKAAMSAEMAAAVVTVAYPPLSLVLHWALTFRPPKGVLPMTGSAE
jgi:putative flippase GtrA